MILKFNCAMFVALAAVSTIASTDAFTCPAVGVLSGNNKNIRSPNGSGRSHAVASLNMVGSWDNDDFLEALNGGGNQQPDPDTLDEDGQGGSRLKAMFEQAQNAKPTSGASGSTPYSRGFQPIANPFLTPPSPSTLNTARTDTSSSSTSPNTNFEELSLEEQARRFREMMKNGGPPPSPPPAPLPRAPRHDVRPVGRNRDADSIANTADLYFAQLKRDSTVRGIARIQGDSEKADEVFKDEGIKELEKMVYVNPHLVGQREKERSFFDTIPEEAIKPYFDPDKLPEEEKNTAGISYKEMIKQRKLKKSGGAEPSPTEATNAPPSVPAAPIPTPPPQTVSQQPAVEEPKPIVQQPNPPMPVGQASPVSMQKTSTPALNSSEQSQKKMRTLMGMILKHRGGPGFGKGRLQGREVEQFENLVEDVIALLRNESAQSSASAAAPTPAVVPQASPQSSFAPPVSAPVSSQVAGDPSKLDSMIACVDGAITMYKNSPPELQPTVMMTLRAALAAAVDTCNGVIGSPDANPAPAMSQVEGTIAVIEGAVTMYKNSPPELQSAVIMTLRSALRSAVATCDNMMGAPIATQVAPAAPVAPAATMPPQPVSPAPSVTEAAPEIVPATDPNSKILDDVYNRISAAAGEGSLGLRSDLTSEDASELADKLVDMRAVLMDELDAGIPDPEPATEAQSNKIEEPQEEKASSTASTVSKYQQMLAKAKAEKK